MPLMNEEDYKIEAYMRLLPNGFNFADGVVSDYTDELPSDEKLQETIDTIKKEYSDNQYQRSRASEYPSITDVVVALAEKEEGDSAMWDDITAKRQAVKTKYKKG